MAGQHPLQFRGIDHVVLKVTNIERTLHFYTAILGLALERVIEDLQIYQLRCGRNLIDLQVAPAGTSCSSSTNTAPRARRLSTTWRLCTISCRT